MNIVFIAGIIESIFFFLIILSKKKKSLSDRALSAWLLIIAINLLIPFFIYTDFLKYIRLNGIDYGLLVLHPIFLFIYTKLLMSEKRKKKINYIIPISAFVISCILVIPYILMDVDIKLRFLYHSEFQTITWIGTIWVNILFIVYFFSTSKLLIQHQKNLKHQYSYTENVNLDWLKYLTIGLIVVYFIGGFVGAILCYIGVPLYYINYFVYATLVLFVFGIGFFGIKQKNIFTNDLSEEKDLTRKQTVISEQDKLFAQRFEEYMIQQKPYLDEKLNLLELSKLLEVKPYYITFILNKVLNKNFYDFVNHYRVEEFKKQISKGELSKYTLVSIAFNCGFNSKASFNRVFKSFTGYNPTEYIRSYSNTTLL